jgi:hypothetical protein
MAWKWYNIDSYRVAVGSVKKPTYYGEVQLMGANFYAAIDFYKAAPLPNATAPVVGTTQRFYGVLDFQQLSPFVDLLRNEKPVRFGWCVEDPDLFRLLTGTEPVGEGDGALRD